MATVKSEELKNCPICGKGCPMDAPSCGRGQRLAEKLAGGGSLDLDAFMEEMKKEGGNRRGHGGDGGDGREHGHHRHGEGHRHDHNHGRG